MASLMMIRMILRAELASIAMAFCVLLVGPSMANAAGAHVSCTGGTIPDGKGGCQTLAQANSAVNANNCPNIPAHGYQYVGSTCNTQPIPAAAAAPPAQSGQPQQSQPPAQQPPPPAQSPKDQTDDIGPSSGFTETSPDTKCAAPIIFDCGSQTMTIGGGMKSTIACGDDTKSDSGVIGDKGVGAGRYFKSMKGATIVNLVPPPCDDCVVHGIPPQNPLDVIKGSSSHGCIHVNPAQLKLLATCKGTAFQVKGNGTGGSSSVKKKVTN